MQSLNANKRWVTVLCCVLLVFSFGVNADDDDEDRHNEDADKSSHQKRHTDNHDEKRNRSKDLNSPEEVIENYFTALQTGDTVEIRRLLGGNLLKSRARLLTNPTYPLTLIEWYRGASFAITGTYIVDANNVSVETSVSRSNTQQVKYNFTLTKDNNDEFHITDETEVLY